MVWLPHNKYMWDFWFAEEGSGLHLFYLQAPKAECRYNPDLRHNLSSVGHAVLTDCGWKEVIPDPAFTKSDGDGWDNLSIWTGSVIQNPHDGRHYMFYTARRREDAPVWTPSEWQRPQQIGAATSADLLRWERTAAARLGPVIPNPGSDGQFDGVAWRDPYIMRGEDGAYYAFICARANSQSLEGGGAIVYVKSDDLHRWDDANIGTLTLSDEFYQMEVPQLFWRKGEQGKRFYLIFCAQEKDCSRRRRAAMSPAECQTGTYYMSSRLLPSDYAGIPELQQPARMLAPGLYAGKLARPETERRPAFFGFVWADEGGHFVGGLSDPLWATFQPDGSIELSQ